MTPHVRYTALIWALLPLIDEGAVLDLATTYEAIETGTLFEVLTSEYRDAFALTASLLAAEDRAEIVARFSEMPGGREFSVSTNGLALLIAYCTEMIQQVVRDTSNGSPEARGPA